MRDTIKAEHIIEVLALIDEVSAVKYQAHKKREFLIQVEALSAHGKWLLSFCYWHCLFNPRFKHVDETAYFGTPTENSNSSFLDFIGVLRHYDRVKVTPRRAAALGKFISGVDTIYREFYLGLIGGTLINDLPQHEAQQMLDIDDIISEEIYSVTALHSSFGTLTYPIALRSISDESSPVLGGVTKKSTGVWYHGDKPSIARDVKFSSWPQFSLTGFNVCGKFYPTDCFTPTSWADYSRGRTHPAPYGDRLDLLCNFLTHNLITEMDDQSPELLHSEDDLEYALRCIIPKTGPTRLLLTDSRSSYTGEARTLDVSTAQGVIDKLWVVDGKPTGLEVWFNGEVRNIPYEFEGTEQAILTAHERLIDQPFRFYRILVNTEEILIGQTILWDAKKWRPKRMKKSRIWIEKCALCGCTDQKHASRGVCKSCEINLRYHFEKHGIEKSIRPSAVMRRSRLASCWSPTLLNACDVTHQGYLVLASKEGNFAFVKNDTTMANYLKQKEKR